MINDDSMELMEAVASLDEGWRLQQTKHTVAANGYLTFQKFKRMVGMNHNFNREEMRRRDDERLSDLVDSANSRSDLESLIDQLEQWIAASPKMAKMINSTDDAADIKNHNQGVMADVTALNKKYLAKAKAKLSSLKESADPLTE